MPASGKREKFHRLSGAQISEEMRALGLSVGEVVRLTGVNPDTLIGWINDADKASQLFASWLAAMAVPGALEAARRRADQLRIG